MNLTNSLEATSYTHAFPWIQKNENLFCSCVTLTVACESKSCIVSVKWYVLFDFFFVCCFFCFCFVLPLTVVKNWMSKEMEFEN